ncbi:beta-1-3-glucanosyltransferas-like protein [Lophiotrema nucula]|uniref:1,3-beta-glucanosyltransferase n=1 Tax=Lophiotrema nucula TaxID=690887 RepID=A0A6A5YI17_9PLEO|nr:beta-1-3-glucanosyltransferas-like protein [Lophiotrema nucula]
MRASLSFLSVAAGLAASVSAQSYTSIPDIQVYGQHFFYTNNGSQFYLKGVAYQQDYSPNGTADTNIKYKDPLADSDGCKRDIPYMKQIFTNVIRVYAIDPTANHDACMEALASADIYVIADMAEPSNSIVSDNPEWDVSLYQRYTSVVDALSKYKNVIGFFAGNENVSADNQTSAAAFVKAAVRDIKGYIHSQNYRNTLGVGYATADVPTRDDLAAYFACEPGNSGNTTQIDFWGYNVYSWCGNSSYSASSYGERVQFFSDYPVPVFFAEYGCNQNIDGGPFQRPFTEVEVLYGNMTDVFSGGIVYEWFESENSFGLVNISDNSVVPNPDFTSLRNQLSTIDPTITQSSDYHPSTDAPACPTTGASWEAVASPLPPSPNNQLCQCMAASLECNVKSDDEKLYADTFDYVCGANSDFCEGIAHNATTGSFGAYGACNPKEQLAWVVNQYYVGNNKASTNCDFSGVATVQSAATSSGCAELLSAAGTAGTGIVASPTGKGTAGATAASSSKSKGAAAPGVSTPAFFEYGSVMFVGYVAVAMMSMVGMIAL